MTYTVLARDPRTGMLGAATASRSLAVGNAVLALRPGVGVVASQAWTNRRLRTLLLDEMAAGVSAAEAVARIPEWDDRAPLRQAAALPAHGRGSAFTGSETTAWSGHSVGDDVVVAGNLLTGRAVVEAMLAAVTASARDEGAEADPAAPASFAARLVRALRAGELAGGDARGRQSAAVVVGTIDGDVDTRVDLRVDDHADPLGELDRLVELRARDLREKVNARTE
jgi:uncharacterized Ntn-hydrolase superfamily protein